MNSYRLIPLITFLVLSQVPFIAEAQTLEKVCAAYAPEIGDPISGFRKGKKGIVREVGGKASFFDLFKCEDHLVTTRAEQFDDTIDLKIDLPIGWEQRKLPDILVNNGYNFLATHPATNSYIRAIAYPIENNFDYLGYVTRQQKFKMTQFGVGTVTSPIKPITDTNEAFYYELTGIPNGKKIAETLLSVYIKSGNFLIRVDAGNSQEKFSLNRGIYLSSLGNVRINGKQISENIRSGLINHTDELKTTAKKISEDESITEISKPLVIQGNNTSNLTEEKLNLEVENTKKLNSASDEQLKIALQQSSTNPKPPTSGLTQITTVANRRALVIGNDTYKAVTKLANAREDARTIASNLTSLGYQVTLKTDLNEKEMKAALRTFAGQVQGGDEVMFFFAGHGVQLGSANYLLPTDIVGDSEAQVRDEAIQLQRILDDMSDRKAKFTLAVIDACRDNPFKSSVRAIGGRGLAATTAATGQMVIFSAGTGQQALDKLSASDRNKNGLFTRIFVQEMQKPNQSVDRVIKNVRNQVAELAKSVGHEQVPAIYDQVLGDFYFKK